MAKQKVLNSAEWANAFLSNGQYVFRRGHHYRWNGQCYRRIADMLMLRQVSDFIDSIESDAATSQMVKSVVETIAQKTAIDDEPTEPLTLNGASAGNIIPFRNGYFSIDEYLEEKLRDTTIHPTI